MLTPDSYKAAIVTIGVKDSSSITLEDHVFFGQHFYYLISFLLSNFILIVSSAVNNAAL